MFIEGHREGLKFDFPKPTHFTSQEEGQESLPVVQEHRTAWDAIGHLEDYDDPELQLTGKWAGLLPSIPEGQNYLYLTDKGGGEPVFGWRRKYWSFLLKLAKRLPSWTVTAQPGPATGPFHWRNRRLSMRELCALQTFPEGYVIPGDLRTAQRQVGNAVARLISATPNTRPRDRST